MLQTCPWGPEIEGEVYITQDYTHRAASLTDLVTWAPPRQQMASGVGVQEIPPICMSDEPSPKIASASPCASQILHPQPPSRSGLQCPAPRIARVACGTAEISLCDTRGLAFTSGGMRTCGGSWRWMDVAVSVVWQRGWKGSSDPRSGSRWGRGEEGRAEWL